MSRKKCRPITAHFQIWKGALWTLRNFAQDSRKDQKGVMKGEDLTLFRTDYSVNSHAFVIEATLTILLKKITSQITFAERKSALLQNNKLRKKILPFVQLQCTIPPLPHQKNTFMSSWHLIRCLQREICKKQTHISYILVQGKTLCTSCLACQHFDFNSTDWFSHNLHMSFSWYLRTMGKEFNRLFQQTFVGQKHATKP